MNAESLPSSWHASLELSFEYRDAGTVLTRNHHLGPLQVQKALYPEGRETCHVVVLHPPGGIAASDRLCIRAALEDGSRALLTTPGAAKWYRSDGDWARQQHHFSVAGDAILEWLPRENIFFDGSNVSMSLDVELSPQAKYFGWEILSFGRRASGESWRHGGLQMRTSIRRANRKIWSEIATLDAGSGFAQSTVGLSGFTVCGTFVVASDDVANELLAVCRRTSPTLTEARFGITRVPGVLIARYLGRSTEEVFNWFTDLWTVLRPALTTRTACMPRLWAC
jgi:urease accessory protein